MFANQFVPELSIHDSRATPACVLVVRESLALCFELGRGFSSFGQREARTPPNVLFLVRSGDLPILPDVMLGKTCPNLPRILQAKAVWEVSGRLAID